ncbi:hypothetical protein HY477_00815 [Candidatus Uhrbacteria bacterium]|nr:hypothetical protein [Candidatus Uhrbacteria bacterium]
MRVFNTLFTLVAVFFTASKANAGVLPAMDKDGIPMCAAISGGLTSGQVVFLSVVLMVFGTALWFLWRQRARVQAALQDALGSLKPLQDAHESMRSALRAADGVDLAQAAQMRMDELQNWRARAGEAEQARGELMARVREALDELGAGGADVSEIAVYARRAQHEISRLGTELANA